MQYNRNAHIENNHSKHSLAHAYAEDGTYLGETKSLDLITDPDAIDPESAYEYVYSQNVVILGQRKIKQEQTS